MHNFEQVIPCSIVAHRLFDGTEAGHMFVIDGLDADGKYHVNFGHLGSGDKFADINVLNQSGTNPGGRRIAITLRKLWLSIATLHQSAQTIHCRDVFSKEAIILNKDTC